MMPFKNSFFEEALFAYADRIHLFNDSLVQKFELKDIPYNLSGKGFPKVGTLNIGDEVVNYRFHGRGATLFWSDIEIKFDIDAGSYHKIITSSWPYQRFLSGYIPNFNEAEYPFSLIDEVLLHFGEKGFLMKRKESEKVFHINEVWYEHQKTGLEFHGDKKNDIDW